MNRLLLTGIFLFIVVVHLTIAQDDFAGTVADIVIAMAEGDEPEFTVLLTALQAADPEILTTLGDPGAEITVFAPTDEAFATLFEDLDVTAEDVLAETDFLNAILFYHVANGVYSSDQLLGYGLIGKAVTTLHGSSIEISVEANEVILNDTTRILVSNIEADNGIIHVIDTVLMPSDATQNDSTQEASGQTCIISTEHPNTVRLRVGPGENRTSVAFLPNGKDFMAEGKFTSDDGSVWFKVNKEEAAPDKAVNETWVAEVDVETVGDCENVLDEAAPPIIPVAPIAPPPVASGGGDTGSTTGDGGTFPQAGTWTVSYIGTTNVSCHGTENMAINTSELGLESYTGILSTLGNTFTFGGVTFAPTAGPTAYIGVGNDGDYTFTFLLRPISSTLMTGETIVSFTLDGVACSGSVPMTFTRE